jgi:hypothetical protein
MSFVFQATIRNLFRADKYLQSYVRDDGKNHVGLQKNCQYLLFNIMTKIEILQKMLQPLNIKFHYNPFSCHLIVIGGQKDMAKQTGALHCYNFKF